MTRGEALLTAVAAPVIVAPSIGPKVIVLLGLQIPIAAVALGLLGLFLSRYIAPKSTRRLTKGQEAALTALLSILLIIIIAGEFPFLGKGEPLGVGMATAWGVCLGTSGILFIEIVGARMMMGLRAVMGMPVKDVHSDLDAGAK